MADPLCQVSQRLHEVLGRPQVHLDQRLLARQFAGKRVLITGAGGSIGSTLSDTLSQTPLAMLTLLDLHENSLFHLRQKLSSLYPDAPLRFVLADVRNADRIRQILAETAPEVIVHLAAYKHVPLAEELPEEFAAVNVLGTWRLVEEARRAGVARIVYPSTDKAINPPSVYGATKRSAELMLQAAAETYPELGITVVRLVNVLGAWGGVIETFVRQIVAGLPVTITDPRMTRYWISMDEAQSLLCAGCAADGTGKILILDLGEPLAVTAVAARLWAMLRPDDDALRVDYFGMRPGERLAEYLTHQSESLVRSDFPGVMQVVDTARRLPTIGAVTRWLTEVEDLVDRGSAAELRASLFDFARGEAGE